MSGQGRRGRLEVVEFEPEVVEPRTNDEELTVRVRPLHRSGRCSSSRTKISDLLSCSLTQKTQSKVPGPKRAERKILSRTMRVSVFTPSHDPRYLDDAFRSLREQSFSDWE